MMDGKKKIVADGQQRAHDASIDHVRAEIEAQYSDELKTAGVWKRMRIRRKMEKEIRERMEQIAPRSGLY